MLENVDEDHEFSRLKQSMEMVGFTPEKQRRLFAVLSAVLLLGQSNGSHYPIEFSFSFFPDQFFKYKILGLQKFLGKIV